MDSWEMFINRERSIWQAKWPLLRKFDNQFPDYKSQTKIPLGLFLWCRHGSWRIDKVWKMAIWEQMWYAGPQWCALSSENEGMDTTWPWYLRQTNSLNCSKALGSKWLLRYKNLGSVCNADARLNLLIRIHQYWPIHTCTGYAKYWLLKRTPRNSQNSNQNSPECIPRHHVQDL